jgi:hypothetical protein
MGTWKLASCSLQEGCWTVLVLFPTLQSKWWHDHALIQAVFSYSSYVLTWHFCVFSFCSGMLPYVNCVFNSFVGFGGTSAAGLAVASRAVWWWSRLATGFDYLLGSCRAATTVVWCLASATILWWAPRFLPLFSAPQADDLWFRFGGSGMTRIWSWHWKGWYISSSVIWDCLVVTGGFLAVWRVGIYKSLFMSMHMIES